MTSMTPANERPETLGETVRNIGDSVMGLAHNRFEFFVVELQEERLRAISFFVWFAVAVTLGVAGLLMALGAIALLAWAIAGYLGLVGLALLTLGSGAAMFWGLCRRLRTGPLPFQETMSEFRKDSECVRKLH